jgi:hypothetical protein
VQVALRAAPRRLLDRGRTILEDRAHIGARPAASFARGLGCLFRATMSTSASVCCRAASGREWRWLGCWSNQRIVVDEPTTPRPRLDRRLIDALRSLARSVRHAAAPSQLATPVGHSTRHRRLAKPRVPLPPRADLGRGRSGERVEPGPRKASGAGSAVARPKARAAQRRGLRQRVSAFEAIGTLESAAEIEPQLTGRRLQRLARVRR